MCLLRCLSPSFVVLLAPRLLMREGKKTSSPPVAKVLQKEMQMCSPPLVCRVAVKQQT